MTFEEIKQALEETFSAYEPSEEDRKTRGILAVTVDGGHTELSVSGEHSQIIGAVLDGLVILAMERAEGEAAVGAILQDVDCMTQELKRRGRKIAYQEYYGQRDEALN